MGMLEIASLIASVGFTAYKIFNMVMELIDSKKADKWQVISRIVSAAVQAVYSEFVKENKDAETGKLTEAAKEKAKSLAYEKVMGNLQLKGLGDELSPSEVLDLIESHVMHKKAAGKAAKMRG